VGDDSSTSFNDFHVDGCNISEVILFLQKLALTPNASSFTTAEYPTSDRLKRTTSDGQGARH
jgi:hypothetical protein